jgi:hypothetical protein
MEFMRVNGAHVTEVGNYYHDGDWRWQRSIRG